MSIYETLIIIFQIINLFFAYLLIFVERRNTATTWAWLLFLFIFPGIGLLAYLFVGQNLSKTRMFKVKRANDFDLLTKYQEGDHFFHEQEINKTQNYLISGAGAQLRENNNIEIFIDGNDKFRALIEDIINAKRFIHLQYFIIKPDELGHKMIDLLTKKASEGIEVKILYDAMGSRQLMKSFFKNFIAAGGKIAVFFPSFIPHVNLRLNYRNHRKIVVVDGKIGYIGGFNIGDEYLGKNKFFGFWRDTHIRISGPAVIDMEERFLLDYTYASNEEFEIKDEYFFREYKMSYEEKPGDHNIPIQIVSCGPDTEAQYIKNAFLSMINSAEKYIYIQTPYFVPDDSILDSLRIAGQSGIDVRIVFPNKPDHPFVYWASYSFMGELLPFGVRFYTYQNGFIHSKMVIVDDTICSIGTTNFDIRSFKLDFEINAFIYDEDFCKKCKDIFLDDIKASKEIRLSDYKNRSLKIRFKEAFSRLVSPIL